MLDQEVRGFTNRETARKCIRILLLFMLSLIDRYHRSTGHQVLLLALTSQSTASDYTRVLSELRGITSGRCILRPPGMFYTLPAFTLNGDKNDYVLDTIKDFHGEYIWDTPVKNYVQLKFSRNFEIPDFDSPEPIKKDTLKEPSKIQKLNC